MGNKWAIACGMALLLVWPLGAANPVSISILWEYKGIPAEMKIFEPGTTPLTLWEMGVVKTKEQLPVSVEISDSILKLVPGMKRQFVLVYHNTGNKPVRFFAAPHQATPVEYSLGFKFDCLCVNHIYSAAPGEYWYRVVDLKLAKEFVGDHLNIVHTLVAVDDERKSPVDAGATHHHEE